MLLISVANELTYPEFHFETETKVDTLIGMQHNIKAIMSYKWMFTIFTHVLPWALNSRGNNFQLEMRLRFFSIGLSQIYAIRDRSIKNGFILQ